MDQQPSSPSSVTSGYAWLRRRWLHAAIVFLGLITALRLQLPEVLTSAGMGAAVTGIFLDMIVKSPATTPSQNEALGAAKQQIAYFYWTKPFEIAAAVAVCVNIGLALILLNVTDLEGWTQSSDLSRGTVIQILVWPALLISAVTYTAFIRMQSDE